MRKDHSTWLAVTCLAAHYCVATASATDEPPARMRYRIRPTPQLSCGVDSLYVCLRAVGCYEVSLAALEEELPAGPAGVSVDEIRDSAVRKGVSVRVLRTDLQTLAQVENPMLLHVNDNHFVVCLGRENGKLLLFDNGVGLLECTPEWFSARYRWEGVAILFGPPPPRVMLSLYGKALALVGCGLACFCFALLARSKRPEGHALDSSVLATRTE